MTNMFSVNSLPGSSVKLMIASGRPVTVKMLRRTKFSPKLMAKRILAARLAKVWPDSEMIKTMVRSLMPTDNGSSMTSLDDMASIFKFDTFCLNEPGNWPAKTLCSIPAPSVKVSP